jgi:hypothetical protein
MHRCEVKIRHDKTTPQEHLLACGDHANKKIGGVWMCDFHYAFLQHIEEYEANGWLKSVTDSTSAKD